ncbi:MAG: hypothetical protein Ta2B_15710 [Termitinemataceae bacterium]|nr:MAG: hypothetical protein Ta2B_15710 [Termitinemataceae bacterium]
MIESIIKTSSGFPTVMCNGKLLHSRFDPQKESERYIESLNLPNNILYVILIECGLCYVIPAIRKILPHVKIISLHLSDYIYKNVQHKADASTNCKPVDTENPQNFTQCADFLEKETEDTEAAKIKIIEWRAALDIYGKDYLGLLSAVVGFVKRLDANKRTTDCFSARWKKNIERNKHIISKLPHIARQNADCIIAAAGPSLENNFSAIQKMIVESRANICEKSKRQVKLISVSSAALALLSRGMVPDIIVTSDGGQWAKHHLNECMRFDLSKTIIAATLNSALPSQYANIDVLPIGDGSREQEDVLHSMSARCLHIPQRGTVSVTAIDLAFILFTGNVYLCGIDLGDDDIKSHTRPYSFDFILENSSNRLQVLYGAHFKRSYMIKRGNSNTIYADWFKQNLGKYKNRLFALGKLNEVFDIPYAAH